MINRRNFVTGVSVAALIAQPTHQAMAQATGGAKKGVMLMNRIGPSSSDLYVANADGSGERKLLQNAVFEYNASFAPDGKSVLFTSERNGDGQSDVFRARLDRTGTLAGLLQSRQYRNVVATRVEAPKAALAYDTAASVLGDALEQFKQGRGLDSGRLIAVVGPLIDSILRNQDAMVWLVCLRKRETNGPQRSVGSAVWAVMLGRHLGFERPGLETLALGGMLLDLGNAKLPAEMLAKEGPLDDIERTIVKKHVAVGLDLIKNALGLNSNVLAMIQHHHERHDGSGYPQGLSGADLPVFGRIAGLVDCFDAMTTKRPYAPARSAYDAVRELNSLSGKGFQKELVEQFVQAVGMFPTGSLVELNTGEVALVIEQNRVQRLRPKLMLLLNADKTPVSRHALMDLKAKPAGGNEDAARWILRGLEPGAFGLDPKDYFG